MKLGIKVGQIMQKNFPIVDYGERITKCVSIMGSGNACIVIKNGNFQGVLSGKEIIEDFLQGLEKVYQGKTRVDIGVINEDSDIIDLVGLMEEESLEFVIVKRNSNIIGIVSRKELENLPSFNPGLERTVSSLNQVTIV